MFDDEGCLVAIALTIVVAVIIVAVGMMLERG